MQTFLPYASFKLSARVLDRARLGKQRVETLQILKALSGERSSWANHPATKMWRGYECALLEYQRAVCREWLGRGYKDTCWGKSQAIHYASCSADRHAAGQPMPELPPWFGRKSFHRAHRSNLLRKKPEHYDGFKGFNVPDDIEYIWPTTEEQ